MTRRSYVCRETATPVSVYVYMSNVCVCVFAHLEVTVIVNCVPTWCSCDGEYLAWAPHVIGWNSEVGSVPVADAFVFPSTMKYPYRRERRWVEPRLRLNPNFSCASQHLNQRQSQNNLRRALNFCCCNALYVTFSSPQRPSSVSGRHSHSPWYSYSRSC